MSRWRELKLEISDKGEVKLGGKELLSHPGKDGRYRVLNLSVHRLVALAFLGYPPTKEYLVHHKDNNSANNKVENLEWLLPNEHAYTKRPKVDLEVEKILTPSEKEKIRITLTQLITPVSKLAEIYGVSSVLIRDIRKHCVWREPSENLGKKLCWADVEEIRNAACSKIELQYNLAQEYNVRISTIRAIELEM